MAASATSTEPSLFVKKYDEFVSDLRGALPEYEEVLCVAGALDEATKRTRFHQEVTATRYFQQHESPNIQIHPGTVLPGVTLSPEVWTSLSDNVKEAIWDHLRVVSICMFLDEFGGTEQPPWMEDAMNELKHKFESTDFSALMEKFSSFFKNATEAGASSSSASSSTGTPKSRVNFRIWSPYLGRDFLKCLSGF